MFSWRSKYTHVVFFCCEPVCFMSVCAVCGSSDFGDPHDGLFFCLECGTQSQDVREEVSQLDDGGGDRFTRRLKAKKGKSKSTVESDNAAQDCVLETYQQVIRRQCDALISLGFDPSLKEAARLIWFTYLRHYGYAFRDQAQSVSGRPQTRLSLSSQPSPSGSGSQCGTVGGVRDRRRGKRKRPTGSEEDTELTCVVKREKTVEEEAAGYDTFPDDKFLFETTKTESVNTVTSGDSTSKPGPSGRASLPADTAGSLQIMESLSSWEELEELERSMDSRRLFAFRQAFLHSRGVKPRFVADDEPWKPQPRVFTIHMTVSLLYLALLYTEQSVLPVDLVRWVRAEKIPLHTPLEGMGSSNVGRQNVFFTTARLVTTAVLIENTFRLYLNLPLPPVPNPNPHQISHMLIDRLKLTECFKSLVDGALSVVFLPVGFTRARMDVECAAVIIIMLRILYGLDDRTELEKPPVGSTDAGGVQERLVSSNSLPVWVDWVQLYCSQEDSASPADEEMPLNQLEVSKMRNQESYLQFCRETVFTKCRPTPTKTRSFRCIDPVFSKKISNIFASVSEIKPSPEHPIPSPQDTPRSSSSTPGPSTALDTSQDFPRLIHLSHFIEGSKAPCTTYRPLPTSHRSREELDGSQLSHAVQFLLSVFCRVVDVPLRGLYTSVLAVERAFTGGTLVTLRNMIHDFMLNL